MAENAVETQDVGVQIGEKIQDIGKCKEKPPGLGGAQNSQRSVSMPIRSVFMKSCHVLWGPLALPLGELSPQVTERVVQPIAFMGRHFPANLPGIFQLAVIFWYGHFYPLRPRYARPPLP